METRTFRRRRRPLLLLALCAVVGATTLGASGARIAHASGSARVHVVGRALALEVRQTFRKSLPAGHASSYFEGVRRRFLSIVGAVLPRLEGVVRKLRRRHRVLRPYDLALPLYRCHRRGACPRAAKRYPAVIELPTLTYKKGDRTAYRVMLAVRRAPSKKLVKRLHAALGRALDGAKMPPHDAKAPKYAKVAPAKRRLRHAQLVVHPSVLSAAPARSRAQVARLVRRLAKRLPRVIKLAAQDLKVRLRRWRKTTSAYKRAGKPLPKASSVNGYDPRYSVRVGLALAQLTGRDAQRAFERALRGDLAKLLGYPR